MTTKTVTNKRQANDSIVWHRIWHREPPNVPGHWLAWTTHEHNGKVYGYMHCVAAYWSPLPSHPDRSIAWCVPWELHKWDGALWSGPVNPPNDVPMQGTDN